MSVHEYARREERTYAPPVRLFRVRLYARGERRTVEAVYARSCVSAVRLAESLNPGYVAAVVES